VSKEEHVQRTPDKIKSARPNLWFLIGTGGILLLFVSIIGSAATPIVGQGRLGTPFFIPFVVKQATATPQPTATATATVPQAATPVQGTATPTPLPGTATPTLPPPSDMKVAIVFVSRQIPNNGSIYYESAKDMPGVGPHSRFRVAAPGKLLVREADGTIRTLIDGANPTQASLNLIDVNAPDVSWDGSRIVFAGLVKGNYSSGTVNNPDAWRIYVIDADGKNLRQITVDDGNLNLSQFGNAAGGLTGYDDTDPVWLPDGRIVFSTTRYPTFGQYSGVRATNLFVVNADGSNLHRITTERNGADRPVIDPITGKIVFSRWWRNHRFATNDMGTVTTGEGEYNVNLGLTTDRSNHVGGSDFLWRNQWHPAAINPDGTELEQWGGAHHALEESHIYGASFLPNGQLLANFFPMPNMTEAAGFGGLRLYNRGPSTYTPILGITSLNGQTYVNDSPPSFGVYRGDYASDATWMPNGLIVLSWASDPNQDYGLYTALPNGKNLQLLYDNPGTTELRAKPLVARTLPPVIADTITQNASPLPPRADGDYLQDGTFTFNALNVYFNGPVDSIPANAPVIGSADHITFFADFQRTSPGSFPQRDWPILLNQLPVAANGSVVNRNAPANLSLFEQIRDAENRVPVSRGNARFSGSAAHVAGMNYGRPGEEQRCVGCHTGHTMLETPETDEAALWSNVAPSASVRVSSSRDPEQNGGLIDRRVQTGEIWRYWTSANGQNPNQQWVELVFPVPITVRTVRLYNPRRGDEANSSIQVNQADVRLYSDQAATEQVAQSNSGALSVGGTNVAFGDVRAYAVRVYLTNTSGTFYGASVASLAEIEVIARVEAP